MKQIPKLSVCVLLLSLPSAFSWAQKPRPQKLTRCCFPVVGPINKQVGYIDSAGRTRIPPRYPFSPLMLESLSYRYGFSDGLAFADSQLIGQNGNTLSPREFRSALPFSEGLAAVDTTEIRGDLTGIFAGYTIIPSEVEMTERWAFINSSGNIEIEGPFDEALPFSEGLAAVRVGNKWGFINKTGRFVISPQFAQAFSFSEGVAAIKMPDSRLAFIDTEGKTVLVTRFEFHPFDDSVIDRYLRIFRANLQRESGLDEPLIDVPINLNARRGEVPRFSAGLFPVRHRKKWGYIDRTGKLTISTRYKYAGNFHEGLARAAILDRWGFIDKRGRNVIPLTFRMTGDFKNGLALVFFRLRYRNLNSFDVYKGSRRFYIQYGYIDKLGRSIFRQNFEFKASIVGGDIQPEIDYPDRVGVLVESSPADSEIFFIPSTKYSLDRSIPYDDEKLALYFLGRTDKDGKFEDRIDQQNYWVLLRHEGRKSPRNFFKVNDTKENKIRIVF